VTSANIENQSEIHPIGAHSGRPERKAIPPGQLLIGGKWVDAEAGETMDVTDPTTEASITQVQKASAADAERAIDAAHDAFENGPWGRMSHEDRAKILFRMADLMDQRAEDFAIREAMDMGMPYTDFRSIIMPHCSGLFRFFAGQAMAHMDGGYRTSYESNIRILTRREPLGVVGAITPWNFPLALTCSKVAPGLAAGNVIIHKPASDTPLTALALAQVALDAGVPDGVYSLLTGPGGIIGDSLVRSSKVDKIAFTGSTLVGMGLIRNGADTIKHQTMELGGKSPNIIFADADWELAARSSPMSVFANAGQDCCARSRVFVERRIFKKFVDVFVEATAALAVGNPDRSTTQVGPLVSKQQREVVESFLSGARQSKRQFLCGGQRLFKKGYYLSPAVVLGCETSDEIWRQEVFGPVVCIRSFANEEAMLAEVNDTPYGLSGSLWTRDLQRALRVARRVESGVLSVNSHSSVHLEAPFGGFKQSGLGRDLGMTAMESYTELKNVYVAE
jgi:aldehyde dehydrogenase (NAD+)